MNEEEKLDVAAKALRETRTIVQTLRNTAGELGELANAAKAKNVKESDNWKTTAKVLMIATVLLIMLNVVSLIKVQEINHRTTTWEAQIRLGSDFVSKQVIINQRYKDEIAKLEKKLKEKK